jgi:murein DD-endopeptidase MepM/ murein hydrolase activator NlpD
MALLPGSSGIGRALTEMASRMSPPKTTVLSPLPAFGAGMTPALDPMAMGMTPAKQTGFGQFSEDTVLDPGGTPRKFDPAQLFPGAVIAGPAPPQPGGQSGMASLGGDWSGVDRWNDVIAAAAAKHGVPENLIKAVMKLESGGDPNSVSVAGATGLMQIMPFWDGTAGYSIHNPEQNIMLGAYILAQNYQAGNPNNPTEKSWEWATRRYLGLGGPDAYGTDHNDYWNVVSNNWNQLNSSSGGGTAGTGFGGNSGAFGSGTVLNLFGQGAAVHDWGEFNAPSGNGLYGYGTEYGMNGSNHTGLDVAMPVGTPLFAPGSGTVTCAGTGNGPGADDGGCDAFSDYFGNGAGRIEVQLANGAVIIYGHSSSASVRPGQQVTAGTLLGTSGGMNSPHIHLEARVRDASMPSGWRIVDPRTVLGSGSFVPQSNPYAQTGGHQDGSFRQSIRSFNQSRM